MITGIRIFHYNKPWVSVERNTKTTHYHDLTPASYTRIYKALAKKDYGELRFVASLTSEDIPVTHIYLV